MPSGMHVAMYILHTHSSTVPAPPTILSAIVVLTADSVEAKPITALHLQASIKVVLIHQS